MNEQLLNNLLSSCYLKRSIRIWPGGPKFQRPVKYTSHMLKLAFLNNYSVTEFPQKNTGFTLFLLAVFIYLPLNAFAN